MLISPKVSCLGGVNVEREVIDTQKDGKEETSIVKSTKTILDIDEFKESRQLRRQLKSKLLKLGFQTSIGIIVNQANIEKVGEIKKEIDNEIKEFNEYSEYIRMKLRMPIFHFTGDNEAAVSVVLDDLNETLGLMKEAVEAADFKAIRNVAKKLRNYDTILPEDAAQRVVEAVASAKKQAKKFRRRLEKEGDSLEQVQKDIDTSPIDIARLMLIDDSSEENEVDISALNQADTENRFSDMLESNNEN
jgi:hypothetical protein